MGGRGGNPYRNHSPFSLGDKIKGSNKKYKVIDVINEMILVKQDDDGSVGVPETINVSDAILVIMQNDVVKYIGFYENYNLVKCIDLQHNHNNLKPHYHLIMITAKLFL